MPDYISIHYCFLLMCSWRGVYGVVVLVAAISSLVACREQVQCKPLHNVSGLYSVCLHPLPVQNCYLELSTPGETDKWKLPYATYRFAVADINADGNDDILVGVIKATRFDTVPGKRIFIFKTIDGKIRPLWLGSRVGSPLYDFLPVKDTSGFKIRTIEYEQSGNYLVAEYYWESFGLKFSDYLAREIALDEAKPYLISEP